jgi:phosphatidylinositol-bisphosphatase
MGDFNYRIENDADFVLMHAKKTNFSELMVYDQMKIEILNKRLNINDFIESDIGFPPTYKYIPGSDDYSIEDKVPGYTDRIL